jgi:type IV pilus assembly protein PilW
MKHTRLPQRSKASSGRSLIELMVAIVIGAMILAGVLVVTAGTSNSGRKSDSQGRMIEAGQVALQFLANETRVAGYSAPQAIFAAGYANKMIFGAGVRGCDTGFSNASGSGAAANVDLLTCAGSTANASAAFSIIYEADNFNTITVGTSDGNVPSDCRGFGLTPMTPGGVGNMAAPSELEEPLTPTYWLVENRYFVGNTGDGDVALMCSGNGAQPFSNTQILLRGIERMTVRYAVGNGVVDPLLNAGIVAVTPDAVQYMTAAQIDANPTWAAETSNMRWQRVVSMRVCLEVTGDTSTSESSSSFVNCDGVTTAITDGRQRRSVTMTMNLRNRTALLNSGALGTIGLGGI